MGTRRLGAVIAIALVAFAAGWLLGDSRSAEAQAPPHYECYDIRARAPGTAEGVFVALGDQFGRQRTRVASATMLCTPTRKAIISGLRPTAATGDHLMCFLAGAFDPPRVVALRNQLGAWDRVEVGPARLLCVPTRKALLQ